MNEFLEQFLIESRDLIEQATADLLFLEGSADDKEHLDSTFRAFHTLKGAAGIMDFAAMGRLMHAAEEMLSAVRSEGRPITPQLVTAGLACLDCVSKWLDGMEKSGTPDEDSEAQADAVIATFTDADKTGQVKADRAWHLDLLQGVQGPIPGDLVAVRYTPDAACFFRGIDPLGLIDGLTGLLAFDCAVADAGGALEEFDPYACRMTIRCLVQGSMAHVAAHFVEVKDQVELLPLSAETARVAANGRLPSKAKDILQEQLRLLGRGDVERVPAVVASVRQVTINICRRLGLEADAHRLEEHGAGISAQTLITEIQGLASQMESSAAASGSEASSAAMGVQRLRVDVERIDALVKLTGELMVVKNAVGHTAGLAKADTDMAIISAQLTAHHALLNRLVSELQRNVLSVRVLPLGQIFQRYPRLVRELAESLGKPARLVIEGESTEADKTIAEALADPLLHVLRNAMDHGIEAPSARVSAGKSPSAAIHLRAARSGDRIVIEIEDDGRGIDVARIRAVAAVRNIVPPAELEAMTDDQAMNLIFAPGFSTADKITDVSGRGVGMDVVRSAIERMGGDVTLESKLGRGTTVRFNLPFTVMMNRLMTVEVSGQVFGVPLEAVVETLRMPRKDLTEIGAARAFVLRDRTIPLIDLARALGEGTAKPTHDEATIVVLAFSGQYGAIEVDKLGVTMDVMLKPMSGLLSNIPGIAGTTLLGDGRVLLVLSLEEFLS